jgi:TctA family transporter
MGVFGVSEVMASINVSRENEVKEKITMRTMMPKREDVRQSIMPMLRGTSIGSFFGALPGTGASIASFMAYAVEKKVAKDPRRFGHGAIEGITAPEAANNAASQTAFIPTLSLGIPGDAVMALMLGALIIHGIQPGPLLMTQQPELFWGLIVSFGIGNVMLMVLNLPMIGLWVAILRIPYSVLYPAILVFISLGVYSVNNNTFDILIVAIIGALGYAMALLKFDAAPLLLGFVLGPLMEENLRRALLLSRGDPSTFIDRPISAGILAFGAFLIVWTLWGALRRQIKGQEAARDFSD